MKLKLFLGLLVLAIHSTKAARRFNVAGVAKRLKSFRNELATTEGLCSRLGLHGKNAIVPRRSFKTALGRMKEKLQQTYGDLEVVGGGISADYTPTRGYTGTVGGELFTSLEEDIPNPDVCNQPKDVVMDVAFKREGITAAKASNIRVKKNVLIQNDKASLTYEINFFFMDGNTPSRPCYFVNACDLSVIYKFNNIQHKSLHKRQDRNINRVIRQSPALGDDECPTESTTQQPLPETTTEETIPEATTEETIPEATTEETIPEATTEETIPEATTEETIPEATTEETIPEATTEETIPEATTEETIPEATTEETIPEATTEETIPEATTEETIPEATTEETIPEATTEETLPETTTITSEATTTTPETTTTTPRATTKPEVTTIPEVTTTPEATTTTPEVTTTPEATSTTTEATTTPEATSSTTEATTTAPEATTTPEPATVSTPESTTQEAQQTTLQAEPTTQQIPQEATTLPEATTTTSEATTTTPEATTTASEATTTPEPTTTTPEAITTTPEATTSGQQATTAQVTCTNPARGEGGNEKVGRIIYGSGNVCLNTTVSDTTCILQNDYAEVIDLKQSTDRSGRSAARYTCSQGYDDAINGAYSPVLDAMYFGTASARMFIEWYNMTPLRFKPRLFCHYGRGYENAFWDGSSLTFGDGQRTFYPLVSLDVVAHELAHGVTSQNSDLIYDDQSGGINEAFSDMAGETTEMFARGLNDWFVGADIFKSSTGALRYFEDPTRDGRSLKHVRDYNDNVNVHLSSGIFNHAFYQMVKVNNMPIRKAFQCFLTANLNYWSRTTTFEEGACDVMRACYDLGYNFQVVKRSFQVVGITFANCDEPSFMESLSASETLNDLTVSSSRTPVFMLEPPQGSKQVTVTASSSIKMAVYGDLESVSPLMTAVGEMVYQLSTSTTSSLYLRLSADTDTDISDVTIQITFQ